MMFGIKKLFRRPRRPDGRADLEMKNVAEQVGDVQAIEGDRGIPSVSRRKSGMSKGAMVGATLVTASALGLLIYLNSGPSDQEKAKAQKAANKPGDASAAASASNRAKNTLPPLDFGSLTPTKPQTEPSPAPAGAGKPPLAAGKPGQAIPLAPNGAKPTSGTQVPAIGGNNVGGPPPNVPGGPAGAKKGLSPDEIWKKRRLSGNLATYDAGSSDLAGPEARRAALMESQRAGAAGGIPGGGGGQEDDLGSKLRPVATPDAQAMMLIDRNFLVAKGKTIDCTLQTRIDSTVPGMVRCVSAEDVYSDNGRVLLMERGTEFTGTQQGGIKQGQARIFVLWARAKTPKGVVITLASPGADPLGGSGLEGYVDSHFWERFGGAIMLSVVQDATSKSAANQTAPATVAGGRDAVTEALRNSINIPPTLKKNHGESVMIYVARDLDFRPVYSLETTPSDTNYSVQPQYKK